MEGVNGGEAAIALRKAPVSSFAAQTDVCGDSCWVFTLKSRTVWFPVLHGRGFL
jgi:hypothetical protein